MDYVKWNEALKNYYFNSENFYKEVILYADIETINLIGEENNLGNYEDFLSCVLINYDSKIALYDKINNGVKRDHTINRKIDKSLVDFPMLQMETKSSFDIIYLNFIIFYITIYINNSSDSFYRNLNDIINKYLPNERRVNSLTNLNVLFNDLEKWSISKNKGVFRAYRIGKLAYKGLLHYQVVLNPAENAQFELFLYKNQIQIDDNALFYELANKILPILEYGKLRSKLIEATSNELYAEWFLNKVKNFDLLVYNNNQKGEKIDIKRTGLLTFYIDIQNVELLLKSDTLLYNTDEPINFTIPISSKDNYGNYLQPITLNHYSSIKFKEYNLLTINGSLELNTQKIKEVNFFEQSNNFYIQTIAPKQNTNLLIIVKDEKNNLERWRRWISLSSRIEKCEEITNDNLLNLFGGNYIFFYAYNIKKSLYKNDENVILETNFNNLFLFKKLGGLKIDKHLYLDIALPYFELQNCEINPKDICVQVFVNGQAIEYPNINVIDNKFYLYIDDNIIIKDISLITIKFIFKEIEKRFDFSITNTEFKIPSNESLFKYNQWGMNQSFENTYLKGGQIIGSDLIELNKNIHPINKLEENSLFDDNYFIYNLTGISSKKENQIIKRIDIYAAIDATLIYLESKGYEIKEHKYSRNILITNLIALGYLTKKIDNNNEFFQLLPPELHQIEKSISYDYPTQAFQLKGIKTKIMLEKITAFCEKSNTNIRFKRYNIRENNDLEKALLPELIYLNFNNTLEQFKLFISEEFNFDIPIISKHHLGDSLLNFINSISIFETEFLKTPLNLDNQPIKESDEQCPRIVESETKTFKNGQLLSLFFLEKTLNKYYPISNYKWSKLYTAFKKSEPILFMSRTYSGQNRFNYSPKVLIPSKFKLPEILYRAFCTINHGVPQTSKYFILNTNGFLNGDHKRFMYFDNFKISEKENRRNNILRIITGFEEVENNQQIQYYYDPKPRLQMYFAPCNFFSDVKSVVLLKDHNKSINAILTNYNKLFISKNLVKDADHIPPKEFKLNNESINMVEIEFEPKETNKILSKILENQIATLTLATPFKKLIINTLDNHEEQIQIIKIQ